MKSTELVVIGGGPAGLSAAISARENGIRNILLIERDKEPGGILQQCIHNGFGLKVFKKELTGPEYARRLIRQINQPGIRFMPDTMVLDVSEDKTVTAVNRHNGLFKMRSGAVILAMGCRERTRGALRIPGTRPAGIFTAGTAQRFVNMEGLMPGKSIVILGSGDIGLIMARRLVLEGAQVKMVCELMPWPGGLERNIVQCLDDYNIPLRLQHTVVKIHGSKRVTGVTTAAVDTDGTPIDGTQEYTACDTVLLSVGLIPENELSLNAGIKLDAMTGGPFVDESMQTGIDGIFACGNVVHVHDLADLVTIESKLAGKSAAKFLSNIKAAKPSRIISTVAGMGIRYAVPHTINPSCLSSESRLYFRPDSRYIDARVKIQLNGKELMSYSKKKMVPGEMESIPLKKLLMSAESYGKMTISIDTKC